MKFELLNKQGKWCPSEIFLAFVWYGFWGTFIYTTVMSIIMYVPWFTEKTSIHNWFLCLLLSNWFFHFSHGPSDRE